MTFLSDQFRYAGQILRLDVTRAAANAGAIMLLCLSVGLSPAAAQQFDAIRTWKDSTGAFEVEAGLKDFNETHVQLHRSNGKIVSLPIARLSNQDQQHLDAIRSLRQTDLQREQLASHMTHVSGQGLAAIELARALRDQYPEAFGAQFLGGTIFASVNNEPASRAQAERLLDEAIAKLRVVNESFPGMHTDTLAAALNNRAIIAIRDDNLPSAVSFLSKAADATKDEILFAVYHNASLLLDSKIDLGKSRLKLARVLARGKPEGIGSVGNSLMFTLAHNPYSIEKEAPPSDESNNESVDSRPPPGLFLTGYGSGFLISADRVLTNRHVAEGASKFRVRNDSDVMVDASVEMVSGHPDVDLAVLKLDQPLTKLTALPVRRDLPAIGESFVVLGYPIPQVFEASLTASTGIVSKVVENNQQILHDASTDPGNSGGPCVDLKGNVLGVHFAGSAVSKNNRNYAVSPVGVQSFLSTVSGYQRSQLNEAKGDFASVIAKSKDSVFMIECYSNQVQSKPSRSSRTEGRVDYAAKYLLIPDRSCLTCFGKGHVDCGRCVNGFNSESRTVKVGANPFSGAPIMAPKVIKKKCAHCGRGGNLSCPTCRGTGWAK